jgi:hypothetical protein
MITHPKLYAHLKKIRAAFNDKEHPLKKAAFAFLQFGEYLQITYPLKEECSPYWWGGVDNKFSEHKIAEKFKGFDSLFSNKKYSDFMPVASEMCTGYESVFHTPKTLFLGVAGMYLLLGKKSLDDVVKLGESRQSGFNKVIQPLDPDQKAANDFIRDDLVSYSPLRKKIDAAVAAMKEHTDSQGDPALQVAGERIYNQCKTASDVFFSNPKKDQNAYKAFREVFTDAKNDKGILGMHRDNVIFRCLATILSLLPPVLVVRALHAKWTTGSANFFKTRSVRKMERVESMVDTIEEDHKKIVAEENKRKKRSA